METREGDIGGLLRAHRAVAGLTQEELAEAAGISARAVSDIERGLRRTLYRHTVARLAEALRLDDTTRARFEEAARGSPTQRPSAGTGEAAEPVSRARLDRLIGRERELDLIVGILLRPDVRLVTLTGTGGIGKTRLAQEAAARASADFVDGVRMVDLAGTPEPSLVVSTLAHALGVRAERASPYTALVQELQGQHLLLVLDTFEHLLDAAPVLVDVLASCPGITALVTSRAPLRVTGEHQIRIEPLATPTSASTDAVDERDLQCPAVELLVERIRLVDPSFEVHDDTAGAVLDIARRLQGLPLAIELAARRVRHMSVAALEEHLSRRFDVLTLGPRDLASRQQTIAATIDWSYELLDAAARRLFRRLAIFAGGCTLDAAAAVAEDSLDRTLDSISELVDHGLLSLEAMPGLEDRYEVLDVIQARAAELAAESGDSVEAGRLHASYFLELAQQAQPHLVDEAQDQWYARLDREHENLRAALRWFLRQRDADGAEQLAGALWMFWRQHGDFAEGRRWLRSALALPGGTTAARLGVLWGAAWLAYHQGDYASMRKVTDEHLALAREAADQPALRHALTEQGMLLMIRGRHAESLPPFRDALAIARDVGSDWIVALSSFNLGHATTHAGDPEQGERLLRGAARRFRTLGDRRFVARSEAQLAVCALVRGDLLAARRLAARSLLVFEAVGERWGLAEGLEIISAADPDPLTAARIAGAAAALRERTATEPMPFDSAVIRPLRERLRAAADSVAWEAAWQEGRRMTARQAVAYARRPTR